MGHWAMSRHILVVKTKGCFWHPVGRGQECCSTPHGAQDGLHDQVHLGPTVNSEEPAATAPPRRRSLALQSQLRCCGFDLSLAPFPGLSFPSCKWA